jgi:hypothetical protein
MPAPESSRPEQPASDRSATGRAARSTDLSSIPAFLREPGKAKARAQAAAEARTEAAPAPRTALPKPATPPPPAPKPPAARTLDPATLPMPSLSRRRVVTAAGVLVASLLVLSFVRQVGEAAAASDRAAELRAANAAMRDEVERLERDLNQVQDLRFIRQEGRSYGLGGRGEVPFALAAGAPELAADAPGSASVRLGVEPRPKTPIDAWLEVLFGAGP